MLLIRSRRSRLRLTCTALAGWFAINVSLASACTIPVFRYALERWESDRFLVIVYHDDQLTSEQNSAIKNFEQRSSLAGGPLNIELLRYDLSSKSPPQVPDVEPPADRPLPWVEVRVRVGPVHTALRWQGALAEAFELPGLFDSPARSEIVRRILDGHSSVWLLIAPEEQAQQLSEQLQAMLTDATRDLALPKGIGLAGSELYAPIPLEIRYSVLPISHTDPREQQLLKWFAAFSAEWRTDAAYVVPVFGRCRALDVIPYADADALLVEEVATFLCGACSCQVKQANPGFDLLASVNWNRQLFGDSIPQHTTTGQRSPSPEYLAIPSGNSTAIRPEPDPTTAVASKTGIRTDESGAAKNQNAVPSAQIVGTTLRQAPTSIRTVLLLVALALVSGGILSGVALMRR